MKNPFKQFLNDQEVNFPTLFALWIITIPIAGLIQTILAIIFESKTIFTILGLFFFLGGIYIVTLVKTRVDKKI